MQLVQEYLGWGGEWQASSPDQATGYNEQLADVIAEGSTAGAAKAVSEEASVQNIPLRLALVGAPFAGKTSMGLKLADEYGCKVCSLDHLLHEMIHCLQDGYLMCKYVTCSSLVRKLCTQ